MKTKLAIMFTALLFFPGMQSVAQQKQEDAFAMSNDTVPKWRLMYSDQNKQKNKQPNALSLLSNNSITLDGEVIRLEVVFTFRSGMYELESPGGGGIEIRTGGLHVITPTITTKFTPDGKVLSVKENPMIITVSYNIDRGNFLPSTLGGGEDL